MPPGSIAVISLQRLGDVITGARVTDGWAQRRSCEGLELVHWDATAGAAALMPGVAQSHALPRAALSGRGRVHPLAAYAALSAIVDGIGRHRFDTVINLSSTRFACLLAPMLARDPSRIHGPFIDDANLYQPTHPAIDYLNTWGVDPDLGVFAHQDLYAAAARVRLAGYAGFAEDPAADTLVAHADESKGDGPIALHLHGSESAKDWRPDESIEGWAGLARTLKDRYGRRVLLLGSSHEQPVLERVAAASGADVVVWPLRHTAALLRRCCGLVSVDTVAIHLAAAVGCPTIVLRQGTARGLAFVPGANALLVDPGSDLATVHDVVRLADRHFFGLPIDASIASAMAQRIVVREAAVDDDGWLGAHAPAWWPASGLLRTIDHVEQQWRTAWGHAFRGDAPPAHVLDDLQRLDPRRVAMLMRHPGALAPWLSRFAIGRAA